MGTNGIDLAASPRPEHSQLLSSGAHAVEDFALAPLVDKIAWGIARGLVVAMKELEEHIASETRKVGETVDRRHDTLQTAMEELSRFVVEQQATNAAVQGRLQQVAHGLEAADAREAADVEALRKEARESAESVSQRIDAAVATQQDISAKQASDLAALQNETRASSHQLSERIDSLCKELGVHQEDVAAVKGTICAFSSRVDALVERLDRQAEAVRTMYTAYSQRESELEQLVDGLARLRAFPTPLAANAL